MRGLHTSIGGRPVIAVATVFATAVATVTVAIALGAAPARAQARGVVINEIHYESPEKTVPEEFIELFNRSRSPADVSGWFFSEGIRFTFPPGTVVPPRGYIVIAGDPETVESVFAIDGVLGPWTGRLDNGGERVVLRDASGAVRDRVDYQARFPWPVAAAGKGSSMELMHPGLDNDLGGSWRASGFVEEDLGERIFLLEAGSDTWLYRKGTSEASDPIDAWRAPDFETDSTWLRGTTSIGMGDDDDATVLDDMEDGYLSIFLRNQFVLATPEVPRRLILRTYIDDGAVVWINGFEVGRFQMAPGEVTIETRAARAREARWEDVLLDGAERYLVRGRNVIAIQAFNRSIGSNDLSIDVELFIPGKGDIEISSAPPTPGARNSAFTDNPPPQIRQVGHEPQQPSTADPVVITAKVTDPGGVERVDLLYQVVLPGQYIPAFLPLPHQLLISRPLSPREPNPAFEDPESWTRVPMRDDGAAPDAAAGDGIYTAALPPQENRILVRYRIEATDRRGASVRVPHLDDPSLNFAYFSYDGVPEYRTTKSSVHPEGRGHVYSAELMRSLPVYILLTRAADMSHAVAYDGARQIPKSNERARDRFNWEGAFVYDGEVYDHVFYRLRQANDRYGGRGKRSMRIRFRKGRYLEARDNYGRRYPTRWRTLNTGKMFDNKRVGNFGLTETMNANLWNMVGVPAPWFHTFHFRVIDGPEEAPDNVNGQFTGDFWGMFNAIEDYDPRFLDAHGLADGNLYKLKDGQFNGNDLKRNQGRFAVTTDADFQNIRRNLRPQRDDAWLDAHVNYDRWYPYHTVVEAVRHYDFRPADSHSKNRAWYFEPDYSGSEFGRLWTLPWDSDASWGPNWNDGVDYTKNAIFAGRKASFKQKYRNFIREFRDLIWTEEVINRMIDDLAAFVSVFSMADRDRWRGGPEASQDFGPIERKIADMKRFAFVSWSGSTGPTVPAGGRARHLDTLAAAEGDAARIPATPTVTSTSPDGFPLDHLSFASSAFEDPQEEDSLAAMKWRLGEVSDPDAPFDPTVPRIYEWPAVWELELDRFEGEITIPAEVVRAGHRYRVRVRMEDDTGRWSHWSEPVEFVAGPPLAPAPQETALRITEVMYNPIGGSGYEFVELQNTGDETLDLTGARFAGGIDFDFASGDVAALEPGAFVVVVRDRRLFSLRYGDRDIDIAGEYRGRLDNGGERLRLVLGEPIDILDFRYDDEWYPTTDGAGAPLVIRDPRQPADLWQLDTGWRPSRLPHGSPGAADDDVPAGLQVPGDVDQSARVNVADAVALLRHLFLGGGTGLPCGDGTIEDTANRVLLDIDGDGSLGITDPIHLLLSLFASGAPPALGRACTPIAGCPSVCP